MPTLQHLIDRYGANAYFYMDRGNGSAWGDAGELMDYSEDAARRYGAIDLRPVSGHTANNGQDLEYLSDWHDGDDGYQYRIGF